MIQAAQNSALMALNAFSTKVQSNANNIANANTDGFKKTRVTLQSVDPNGVEPSVGKITTPGPVKYEQTSNGSEPVEMSNVDLGEEIPDMMLNSNFYQANLKSLQTSNEMAGSLLNIKG